MIAADTSSFVAWLEGGSGDDVDLIDAALADHTLVLPPVVQLELLSAPAITPHVEQRIEAIPVLEIREGYWQRAGRLRRLILRSKRKARTADVMVAQSCIDHGVPLVTRDGDFRNFAPVEGLRLL